MIDNFEKLKQYIESLGTSIHKIDQQRLKDLIKDGNKQFTIGNFRSAWEEIHGTESPDFIDKLYSEYARLVKK